MPSSFTNLLKLELPATGELAGLWGQTVNNAITTPVSEAIAVLDFGSDKTATPAVPFVVALPQPTATTALLRFA